MSETNPADLTIALQKSTEGFTAIVDRPKYNDVIEIRQLLLPVLMKTKYDEISLTHNLLVFILTSERYQQIYKKGAYLTPPPLHYAMIQLIKMQQEQKCIELRESTKQE